MEFKAKLSLLVAAMLLSTSVSAVPVRYSAKLDGPSESPPVASPGLGNVEVVIDTDAKTLTINTTFSGLVANTTQAHIHCCTATTNTGTAGVAVTAPSLTGFPLSVTSGTYSDTFDLTQNSSFGGTFRSNNGGTNDSAMAALATGLKDGKAYLNIHSSTFQAGEIRGFLQLVPATPVPMPAAALWIFGAAVGLGGIWSFMRRRRA